MPEQPFQERTEPATPRRRHQAREEGKVARSQELGSAFVLLASMGLLALAGPFMLERMMRLFGQLLSNSSQIELRGDLLVGYFSGGIGEVLIILAPLAGAVLIVGLLVNFAQVGFTLTWKPLSPKLDKLSPVRGFQRMFSKQSFVELAKSLLKVTLVAAIAYYSLRGELPRLASMVGTHPLPMFGYAAALAVKLGVKIGLALLGLALFDYAFQRWDFEKSIMMSRKELEEETRQTEGDPRVRARVRSVQREMAMRRMMDAVKTADVVVTNPIRFAVALKYDRETMKAPKVVAKGARKMAARIRDLAKEQGVPIVEDPPLARLLYKQVEIDQEVPVALFRAVAELLAYVYRMKNRRPRAAALA
jgi:flagellar biosynthesis protein FlhB